METASISDVAYFFLRCGFQIQERRNLHCMNYRFSLGIMGHVYFAPKYALCFFSVVNNKSVPKSAMKSACELPCCFVTEFSRSTSVTSTAYPNSLHWVNGFFTPHSLTFYRALLWNFSVDSTTNPRNSNLRAVYYKSSSSSLRLVLTAAEILGSPSKYPL